jgi:FAD/FMN-containing dehydrogenase
MILGGFGFLSRLHGLSIDNLVEAEVVLADGSIVIANEKEHAGTLLITSSAVIGGMC